MKNTIYLLLIFFVATSVTWAQVVSDGLIDGTQDTFTGQIPDSEGDDQNPNLFHSFAVFNVSDAAQDFENGSGFTNIIVRNTFSASLINNELDVNNASLYFINNVGDLTIGSAGRILNSTGVFLAPRSQIALADGGLFTNNGVGDDRTNFPVALFNFSEAPEGGINLVGTDLNILGEFVALGGSITVSDSTVQTNNNNLTLIGVGSDGQYTLLPAVTTTFSEFSDVTLSNSGLDAGVGGDVFIAADQLNLLDGVTIDGDDIEIEATGITTNDTLDINAQTSLEIDTDITAGGDVDLTAGLDDLSVGNINAGTNNITLDSGDNMLTGELVGGNIDLSIGNEYTNPNSITASGSINIVGLNDISIGGDLTSGDDIIIDSTAGSVRGGDVNTNGNDLLVSALDSVAFDDISANSVDIDSLSNISVGNIDATDIIDLENTGGDNIVTGSLTSGSDISVIADDFLTINGSVNSTGDSLLSGGDDVSVTGSISAVNALLNAGGDLSVSGDVNITEDFDLTAETATFSGDLNIGDDFSRTVTDLIVGGTATIGDDDFTIADGESFSGNMILENGDLTIQEDGVYNATLNGVGDNDGIQVNGDADIDGTININVTSGNFVNGSTIDIVNADNLATSGTFQINLTEDLDQLEFVAGRTSTRVIVQAYYDFEFLSGDDDIRVRAVADSLDRNITGLSDSLNELIAPLGSLDNEEVREALLDLQPDLYDSYSKIAFDNAHFVHASLFSRVFDFRNSGKEDNNASASLPIYLASTAEANEIGPIAETDHAVSEEKLLGVFFQPVGIFGKRDSASQTTEFDYKSFGFVAGLDYKLDHSVGAGIYASYLHSEIDYDDPGNDSLGEIDAIRGGIFFRIDQGGFFAVTSLGYGHTFNHMERKITFADVTALSDFDSDEYMAFLSFGYKIPVGSMIITPLAGVEYVFQDYESFRETEAGGLSLDVDDRKQESLQTQLGLRLQMPIALEGGLELIPEFRGLWVHEFENKDEEIDASLVGNLDNPFTVPTQDADRDAARLGGSIALQKAGMYNFAVTYDSQFDSDQYAHKLSLILGLEF